MKAHARNAKRTKEELTEGLEHKKVVCELPEQERICAKCGSAMVRIGEKFVRSELVIVPAQVYMVDYYAASYKCAHCEAQTGESYIRQAQAPVPVMKKSMAAPSTVAYVMQEKFQNGVPLYRQEAYWKGQGVEPVSYTHLDVYKRQPTSRQKRMMLTRSHFFVSSGADSRIAI